jgi:hypothetical protein
MHGKFALLARILPRRYAEVVRKEDAKLPLPALHEVINTVLARAAHKEQAALYAGAAAAVATAAPLGVDAVSAAALRFGLTQEEAARYLADEAGSRMTPTGRRAELQPLQHPSGHNRERTSLALCAAASMNSARVAARFAARISALRCARARRAAIPFWLRFNSAARPELCAPPALRPISRTCSAEDAAIVAAGVDVAGSSERRKTDTADEGRFGATRPGWASCNSARNALD